MGIAEAFQLAPLALSLGFLLEPPFDRYVKPIFKAFGKEF